MELRPGTDVTPNVRLESQLAMGAMGSVWVAEHLTLNTKVAVKFISSRLDPDDPEVLERFIREASTAAQIKSSHVVQTFDQGVMRDGTPYIVMEYLEGEGLGERLIRDRTVPLVEVVKIIGQTAKALSSAHKVGVIHRDIKPDNVFLSTRDDELHVKIFDFGIAKQRQHAAGIRDAQVALGDQPELGLTNDGVMIGTPEYMSPEQVMSASSVDHHADLWGLAVVAYVAITGELPFKGKDVGELCVRLLEGIFSPPRQLRPELPPEVDVWFAKALARAPEARFQSAREMATALRLAVPMASSPDDSIASGQFDVPRGSAPSMPDSGEYRGVRAVTLTDLATDKSRGGFFPRWSPSTVGAVVAVVMLTLFFAVFMLVGGSETELTPAATVEAVTLDAPPAAPPTLSANVAASASASALSTAEPAPKTAASGTTAPPVRSYPGGTRWKSPPYSRPKDPGF